MPSSPFVSLTEGVATLLGAFNPRQAAANSALRGSASKSLFEAAVQDSYLFVVGWTLTKYTSYVDFVFLLCAVLALFDALGSAQKLGIITVYDQTHISVWVLEGARC